MKGAETHGATNDPLARAGEGTTVRVLTERCPRCGARLEEIRESYTRKRIALRCRGGCKPAVCG
ncbi:MAG: hypothetical protein WC683_07775 [bacterium]